MYTLTHIHTITYTKEHTY